MPQPYIAFLVYGRILNSLSKVVHLATLNVTTSVGSKSYTADSDGIYLFDLADIGYVSGETVTINVTEPFNNELKTHTFVVSGNFNNEDITLALRTAGVSAVGYVTRPIIHSVGNEPVTRDNPLPVSNNKDVFEEYQPSDETSSGDPLYYGFVDRNGNWYIMEYNVANGTFRYIKGSSNYTTNWTNRTSLTYGYFHNVF